MKVGYDCIRVREEVSNGNLKKRIERATASSPFFSAEMLMNLKKRIENIFAVEYSCLNPNIESQKEN